MANTAAVHSETLHTLIALAVVSLSSMAGLVSFALGRRLANALPYLVSAAAGALLGTAFAHLLPEAVEELGPGRWLTLLLLAGVLGSFLLERLLGLWFAEEAGKPLVTNILLGGAAHSFLDGMAIATAFAVGHKAGLATTIAVVLHEIPHHIADVGVLLYGGVEKRRAILLNLLATGGCAIGGVFVLLLGARATWLVPLLLPLTAANFIYISMAVLLPEMQREANRKQAALQSLFLLAGVALMCVLSRYVEG